MDYVLTANSPGEVSAWVRPVIAEIRASQPSARITVAVPPCTFASGAEIPVLKGFGPDQLLTPREVTRLVLLNKLPAGFVRPSSPGVVVHLGGDFGYTALIARRFGLRAVAYTEGLVTVKRPFSAFCVPYGRTAERLIKAGVPKEKVLVTGNLMVDAVKPILSGQAFTQRMGLGPDVPYVLVLPGSRPYELSHVAPLFIEALMGFAKTNVEYRYVIALSSFGTVSALMEACSPLGSVALKDMGDGCWVMSIASPCGGVMVLQVVQGFQYDAMAHARFALTIPGTNTAELAILKKPAIVVVPLNWPGEIPLEGLPGLLGSIPLIGRRIKAVAVMQASRRIGFTALPNMIAGKALYPELMGVLSPDDITRVMNGFVRDIEQHASDAGEASLAIGSAGASRRLLETAKGFADSV